MISFSIDEFPTVNKNWLQQSVKEIAQVVEEENKSYWSQEKSPATEQRWVPRKEPTGNWPILNKTGNLFQKTKFSVGNLNSLKVTYPSYGRFLMEKRPWLGVPKTTERKISEIIANKIFL